MMLDGNPFLSHYGTIVHPPRVWPGNRYGTWRGWASEMSRRPPEVVLALVGDDLPSRQPRSP